MRSVFFYGSRVMLGVNRRKLLIGTAVGLTTSYAGAMTSEHDDGTLARPDRYRPSNEPDRYRPSNEDAELEPQPKADPDPSRPRSPDPVAFWSDTILGLVALDHSIDA